MTPQRPWLTGIRLFVAFALFAVTGGTALALQGDLKDRPDDDELPGLVGEGEYVSPQYGVEITWTDAWAVGDMDDENVVHAIGGNFDSPVASDPDGGDIVFLVDTASETSVLSLGFSPTAGAVDPELLEQAMAQPEFLTDNLFLSEDAEILLLDSNSDNVAILAREAAPNDDHVVYMQLAADPGSKDYDFWVGLDMYEPDEYENILTSMDDDIDVEDNDIFDVFDAGEILAALESDTPVETEVATEEPTEEPVETEEPTEEPLETEVATEEATEEPATETATEEGVIPPFEQTQTPISTEEAATPQATPTAEASPQASPATDELPGLLGEGNYESPQHGVPVTWTDAWGLDPNTDPAIQSFTETGVDSLHLADSETQGAIVYITIENAQGPFDPDAVLEAVSSPGYIESVLLLDPSAEIVLTQTDDDTIAVMYLDTSGDEPFVSILEAHAIDDDTIAYIELRSNAADIDAALLDSVEEDIEVNGDDAIDELSSSDILDALP